MDRSTITATHLAREIRLSNETNTHIYSAKGYIYFNSSNLLDVILESSPKPRRRVRANDIAQHPIVTDAYANLPVGTKVYPLDENDRRQSKSVTIGVQTTFSIVRGELVTSAGDRIFTKEVCDMLLKSRKKKK
jgi:hypothetical protein